MRTTRLDDAISIVAYVLDVMVAYRNIVDSGDCNNCARRMNCEYSPKPGQQVRYNCPFYVDIDER